MTKHMQHTLGALAALGAILSFTPAHANILFRGDYETGDVSQWTSIDRQATDRFVVVTSPVAQGQYAVKATVQPGDLVYNGARAEAVWDQPLVYEGQEQWYHWYTYWPSASPIFNSWQLITQWHHTGTDGSPPVEFAVEGPEITLRVMGQLCDNASEWNGCYYWRAPFTTDVWHEFTVHVKWSSDPSVGFMEVWYDRQQVVPLTHGANMFAGEQNYLKQGLYRDRSTISVTQWVFHDGMTVGTTAADVLPAGETLDGGASTPPAGTGSTGTGTGTGTGSTGTGTGGTDTGSTGTGTVDAGTPTDPGTGSTDPATPPADTDAGTVNPGTPPADTDAGTVSPGTPPVSSTGQPTGTQATPAPAVPVTGGCNAGGAGLWMLALSLVAAALLRRRRA